MSFIIVVAIEVANFLKGNSVAKLLCHTFVVLLFSKHYIKKFFSGALLIVLLFVHSVKLLHSHPNNKFCPGTENKVALLNKAGKDDLKLTPDCEICNYHLTKDTDHYFSLADHICKFQQTSFYSQYTPSHSLAVLLSFETRGPPAVML